MFVDGMDPDCVALCEAMNALPGIETIDSCCGHGKRPYRIFFRAESLEVLPRLVCWFYGCHHRHYGWRVTVEARERATPPGYFKVEGPVGAYEEAEDIAELIQKEAEKK